MIRSKREKIGLPMKLIVAGCRDFCDYYFAKTKLDNILSSYSEPIEFVSGRCSTGAHTFTADDGTKVYGADGLVERYAKENNIPITLFRANWTYGASGGPIRNDRMAKYATHCVCFWDGKSAGTKNMISLAKKYDLALRVILIN